MTEENIDEWTPWIVDHHFEVQGPSDTVTLCQVTAKDFAVPSTFRFVDRATLESLAESLRTQAEPGADIDAMIDDARTFPESSEQTDLASIPRFLTWFENKYGRHTLAAIIHDRLILSGDPNLGALRSDTLSDRFFRMMMIAAGVPPLKAWIMWAAVAMRTRWAAQGLRRWSLVLWVLLATAGITMFAAFVGTIVFDWDDPFGLSPAVLGTIALIMPLLSAPLWGQQWGASFIAAVAAVWILPPAVGALLGFIVYRILEVILGPAVRSR